MLDIEPSLVSKLKQDTNLPVYNENFITSKAQIPCITYIMANDVQSKKGDTLGYSEIYYYVKIWGKKQSVLQEYAPIIDASMREMGFTRVGATELWFEGTGQKQLRYQALGLEKFNNGGTD